MAGTLVRWGAAALLAVAATAACGGRADSGAGDPRLASLPIDRQAVTVGGASAGGYMAVQVHVAHSGVFQGAAVLAGGPYLCAKARCATVSPLHGRRGGDPHRAAAGGNQPARPRRGDRPHRRPCRRPRVDLPRHGRCIRRRAGRRRARDVLPGTGDSGAGRAPRAPGNGPPLSDGQPGEPGLHGNGAAVRRQLRPRRRAYAARAALRRAGRGIQAAPGRAHLFRPAPVRRGSRQRGLAANGWLYVPSPAPAAARCSAGCTCSSTAASRGRRTSGTRS